MKKLTFSMENYLEAIYELSSANEGVRLTDIAEKMGVTKASANNAMTVLMEKGMVTKEKYQDVYLTSYGKKVAESTSKKHHMLQRFLSTVLKVDKKIADTDACAIEHVISDVSVAAMADFLANYKAK